MTDNEISRRGALKRAGSAAVLGIGPSVGMFSPEQYEPACVVEYRETSTKYNGEDGDPLLGLDVRYEINDDRMAKEVNQGRLTGDIEQPVFIDLRGPSGQIQLPPGSSLFVDSLDVDVSAFKLQFFDYDCSLIGSYSISHLEGGAMAVDASVAGEPLQLSEDPLASSGVAATCRTNPEWGEELYGTFSDAVPEYNRSVAGRQFGPLSGGAVRQLLGGTRRTLRVTRQTDSEWAADTAVYRMAFERDLQIATFEQGAFDDGRDLYATEAAMRKIPNAGDPGSAFLRAVGAGNIRLGGTLEGLLV